MSRTRQRKDTGFWRRRQREDNAGAPLWEWLPWEVPLDRERGILGTTNGGLLCGFRLEPQDLSGRTTSVQRAVMRAINTAWRPLPPDTAVWIIARRVTHRPKPTATWTNPVARWLDEERCAVVNAPGRLWDTELTCWVWHKAEPKIRKLVRSLFIKRSGATRELTLDGLIEAFWTMVSRLASVMRHGVRSLTPMDSDQALTELFTRFSPSPHAIVTPRNPRAHLSHLLAQEVQYHPGLKPYLETSQGLQAVRCLSFTEEGMPPSSFPGMLSGWYQLPLANEWSSRIVILDREKARKTASNSQFNWGTTQHDWKQMVHRLATDERTSMRNRYVERQSDDADMAVDELLTDEVAHVILTTTYVARSSDAQEADHTIRQLENLLHARGIVTRYEGTNTDDAWFGTLPGLPYVDVGALPVNSMNAIDLCPFTKPSTGRVRDDYLQAGAWLHVRTEEANPYAIANKVRDNGHFKVVGPTRAGKSVLAADMVSRWGQYPGAHVDWWDIDGSARCLTLCLNGVYHDICLDGIGYQPYALIHQPAELAWAFEWTKRLLESHQVVMTESKRRYLSGALQRLAERPPRGRTFTGLYEVMVERPESEALMRPKQTEDLKRLELERAEVRDVIKDFMAGGIHGGLLDAETDRFGESWLHTFALRGLLRQPALVEPVTSLLFHRAELRFDTRHPTLVIMDDAAVSWAFPAFERNGKDWLVSTAKKNVSLGFFTHSLTQVFNSPIGALLIESCLQTFCLPNAAARTPELKPIYERLGCTDTDIEIISRATPQRDVYYLCDEIEERRLFRLDVPPSSLKLLARNRAEDHQAIDEILRTYGPDDFAYHWLIAQDEPDAAERLREWAIAAD